MIAEIYKKANFETEGKEDILTGNFFGAIAYTECFGDMLGPILRKVSFGTPDNAQYLSDLASVDRADDYKIKFWEKFDWLKGKKEPDLFLEFKDFVICIEVKYHSGLSGIDQLETYARLLEKHYAHTAKRIWLIFLAKQPYAREIFELQEDIGEIGINGFGYLSWQNVHEVIRKLAPTPLYARRIQKDLLEYLQAKQLNGFTTFPVDDYLKYPNFSNIKAHLNTEKKQLHMIDLETRQNISKAFEAVHEVYASVKVLLIELDCNFGVYSKIKVEGSKNAGNYMTWQSVQETYGWLQTIFIKLYRHSEHPDKLFLIDIDLSSDVVAGPQMRFALHQFRDQGSIPTKFEANDGWLYNQRRTNPKHFDIDIENACSIPKMDTIRRDKGHYGHAHSNFKKAWFSSCDLFEVTKENLEYLVLLHFNALLEKCNAGVTQVHQND